MRGCWVRVIGQESPQRAEASAFISESSEAYEPVPLLVNTAGTELNQVWANIIENAIDAMQGECELRVRTFCEDHYVAVDWLSMRSHTQAAPVKTAVLPRVGWSVGRRSGRAD